MKKLILIAGLLLVVGCEPKYDNKAECTLRESQKCPASSDKNYCIGYVVDYCECAFGDEESCDKEPY